MTAAGLPAPTEDDVRAAAEAIVRAFAANDGDSSEDLYRPAP